MARARDAEASRERATDEAEEVQRVPRERAPRAVTGALGPDRDGHQDSPSPPALSPLAPVPSATSLALAVPLALVDPTAMTVKHGARLLEGELFATSSRIEWAVLRQRTFGFDSLRCPKGRARMRLLATVTDPGTVKKILTPLGVRTEPLPRARTRDPTGQESFHFNAA